jgi:hypothetical protein
VKLSKIGNTRPRKPAAHQRLAGFLFGYRNLHLAAQHGVRPMKIHWENLTDEMIERAGRIEAVDPRQRRAFQIWSEALHDVLPGYPARRSELEVFMCAGDFRKLVGRVRDVKDCLPAMVEALNH